jgi:hypothetical protein
MQGLCRPVTGICAALAALALPAGAEVLLFIKETIAVSILVPDTVEVMGDYFFTAADSSVVRMPLFYPFPVDSSGEYPCFIEVKNTGSGKAIEFGRDEQGIMFPVSARAGDTTAVTVVYKQRVKNRSGRYILTTTGIWGRPLIDSKYSVSVPDNATLNYMSYECDSVAPAANALSISSLKNGSCPTAILPLHGPAPRPKAAVLCRIAAVPDENGLVKIVAGAESG